MVLGSAALGLTTSERGADLKALAAQFGEKPLGAAEQREILLGLVHHLECSASLGQVLAAVPCPPTTG
jgi:hypothetical protein